MINLNDDLLKNFKKDLEEMLNKCVIRLYENGTDDIEEMDVATVTANIKICLKNIPNEVTDKMEKVPVIAYETKYKIPEEVKEKGKESADFIVSLENEELVLKKRQKAQISFDDKEETEKHCGLGKDKYQDIYNCKNRKNDSCEKCKEYR